MGARVLSLPQGLSQASLALLMIALLSFTQGCSKLAGKTDGDKAKAGSGSQSYAQLVAQAEQAFKSNQMDVAFNLLDQAVQAGYPKDSAEVQKGKALLAAGNNDKAAKRFDDAIRANPGNREAAVFGGYAAYLAGDYSAAEARLVDMTAQDQKQYYARYLLGTVYNKTGKSDLAVKEFQAVIAGTGENPDILNNLGISYFILGQYENAKNTFSKAVTIGHSKRAQNNLALTLCRMKRFDEAFRTFKMTGGEAFAYNNVGCCYIDAGDNQRAMEFFNKSMSISPTVYKPAHANILRYGGGQKESATVKPGQGAIQSFDLVPAESLKPSVQAPVEGGALPAVSSPRAPTALGKP